MADSPKLRSQYYSAKNYDLRIAITRTTYLH